MKKSSFFNKIGVKTVILTPKGKQLSIVLANELDSYYMINCIDAMGSKSSILKGALSWMISCRQY